VSLLLLIGLIVVVVFFSEEALLLLDEVTADSDGGYEEVANKLVGKMSTDCVGKELGNAVENESSTDESSSLNNHGLGLEAGVDGEPEA